jgi:pyruvate dehydrogenase E1 component beta subunit
VALEAAQRLADAGISCEVVDLRTLAPLDTDLVCRSAARTGALLTLEEGQVNCGVGTEVAFRVREAVGPLKCARVGALPAPVSSNPVLEAACVPDAARVCKAARSLLSA